jgi:hypothetical protein
MQHGENWRPTTVPSSRSSSLPLCSPPSRPCRLRRWPATSLDRSYTRRHRGDQSGRRNSLSVEPRNSCLRGNISGWEVPGSRSLAGRGPSTHESLPALGPAGLSWESMISLIWWRYLPDSPIGFPAQA